MASKVGKCRDAVYAIGKKIFGVKYYNMDLAAPNAFRHALWNAFMTVRIGKGRAKQFADAHESGKPRDLATIMDFHNNAQGREIGSAFMKKYKSVDSRFFVKGKSMTQILVDDVMSAFKTKKLFWCPVKNAARREVHRIRTTFIPKEIKKYKSKSFSVSW